VNRVADRGAITAAYVGIGMAVTICVSFLLFIPIEPIVWLLALPSGVLIGYYANARSNRRAGPWSRILSNALFAGVVTGLTAVLLLLIIKGLFFFADNGYRDPGQGGSLTCQTGADCVYQRYLDAGRGADMAAIGVSDAASFTGFYWREQFGTGMTVFALTAVGGLVGGLLYGTFRPKPEASQPVSAEPGPSSAEPVSGSTYPSDRPA
jgi:hypothetical protein